eukprot:3795921-Rhodomonas_salina.1
MSQGRAPRLVFNGWVLSAGVAGFAPRTANSGAMPAETAAETGTETEREKERERERERSGDSGSGHIRA